jgi:hypothetical protein
MGIPEFSPEIDKKGDQLNHYDETQALIEEVRSIFGFVAGEEILFYKSLNTVNHYSTPLSPKKTNLL